MQDYEDGQFGQFRLSLKVKIRKATSSTACLGSQFVNVIEIGDFSRIQNCPTVAAVEMGGGQLMPEVCCISE
jgi:hypothetical protein